MRAAVIHEYSEGTFLWFTDHNMAAAVATAMAKDEERHFYQVVAAPDVDAGYAVEVCDGNANFLFYL